jgi:hypothetical protein
MVLTGFLGPSEEVFGRPVGVAITKDGALLVADDVCNALWRVTAADEKAPDRIAVPGLAVVHYHFLVLRVLGDSIDFPSKPITGGVRSAARDLCYHRPSNGRFEAHIQMYAMEQEPAMGRSIKVCVDQSEIGSAAEREALFVTLLTVIASRVSRHSGGSSRLTGATAYPVIGYRHDGTRGLPSDMVERIFALGFALEQLRLNLRDLRRGRHRSCPFTDQRCASVSRLSPEAVLISQGAPGKRNVGHNGVDDG